MVDAKCKECGALFVIDSCIPEEMECFCGSEVFEIIEKSMVIA